MKNDVYSFKVYLLSNFSDVISSFILELVMNLVALFWTFCMFICDLLFKCNGIAGYRSLDLTSWR